MITFTSTNLPLHRHANLGARADHSGFSLGIRGSFSPLHQNPLMSASYLGCFIRVCAFPCKNHRRTYSRFYSRAAMIPWYLMPFFENTSTDSVPQDAIFDFAPVYFSCVLMNGSDLLEFSSRVSSLVIVLSS